MAPLIASSGRLRFQKVSLLSKVEGSPPLFPFQRDIASPLSSSFLRRKSILLLFSLFFLVSSGRKTLRDPTKRVSFFSLLFTRSNSPRFGDYSSKENISAADENNPSIDEIGVAIGGMLENIIGE